MLVVSSYCYALYATSELSDYNPVMLTTAQNTVNPRSKTKNTSITHIVLIVQSTFFQYIREKKKEHTKNI